MRENFIIIANKFQIPLDAEVKRVVNVSQNSVQKKS